MDDVGGSESSKQFLERLMYSNSERLLIKANDKGKNPLIWSQFDIAYIDGIEQKYACCKLCKSFIKYSGRTGTGGLMRHFCYKKFGRSSKGGRSVGQRTPLPLEETDKSPSVRLQIEALIHQNSPRIGYVRNAKGKSEVWSQFQMITVDNVLSNFACCIACKSLVTYMSRTGTGSMTRHKCQSRNYAKMFGGGSSGGGGGGGGSTGDACYDIVGNPYPSADAMAEVVAAAASGDGGVVIKSEEAFDWDDKGSSDRGSRLEDATWLSTCEYQDGDEPEGVLPTEVERALTEKHLALVNKSLRLFDVFENEEFLELAQFLVNLGARYGQMDVKKIFKRKINLVTLNDD